MLCVFIRIASLRLLPENVPSDMCAQRRFRSAFAFTQSLGAFWVANDVKFLNTDNEDSDETAWIRRLICVFVGRTCQRYVATHLKWRYKTEFYQKLANQMSHKELQHEYDLRTIKWKAFITKTRLFKYIEDFTTKNWKFSDIFFYIFLLKT